MISVSWCCRFSAAGDGGKKYNSKNQSPNLCFHKVLLRKTAELRRIPRHYRSVLQPFHFQTGHCLQDLILLGVESFLHRQTFFQIEIDHAAVTRADEAVRLALGENLDGVIAMRVAMTRSRAVGVPPRWM